MHAACIYALDNYCPLQPGTWQHHISCHFQQAVGISAAPGSTILIATKHGQELGGADLQRGVEVVVGMLIHGLMPVHVELRQQMWLVHDAQCHGDQVHWGLLHIHMQNTEVMHSGRVNCLRSNSSKQFSLVSV